MSRKYKAPYEGSNRRREPRLRLASEVIATVQTSFTATVLDLSIGGAQLDIAYSLKPGGPCALGLPHGDEDFLKVQGRVVRSTLSALKPSRSGEPVAHYRAAIEFVDLSDEQRTVIEELLLHFEGSIHGELDAEVDSDQLPADAPVVELEADLPPPGGAKA
jgi:hypothetical protein